MTIRRVTLIYLAALVALVSVIPLWLDEVLTMMGVTQPSLAALLQYIRTFSGGTPLTFLPARASVAILGNTLLAARLPSILSSAAALPGIYFIARRLELRQPMLAVAVFALWPLQLRYALEARPYALALCCTVWLTYLVLDQSSRALYAALTIVAALAQPYALFIPVAHVVQRRRFPILALALAALVLFPWYAHFRADWLRVNQDQNLLTFDPKSILVLLREISGSGYIGLAILATGTAFARRRDLWMLVVIPIALAFAANTAFHYFFAVRQVIYILPAPRALVYCGHRAARQTRSCPPRSLPRRVNL
ncbi:MAG: glycosyltransferase family 39 protein [Acidobacteriota bacterium]